MSAATRNPLHPAPPTTALSDEQFHVLRIVNLTAIILMLLHDVDHLRVIFMRSYALERGELVPAALAYVPSLCALMLALRRSPYAALGSFISGSAILIGVIMIHAVGMGVINAWFEPFFREWGVSYCTLGLDYVSWASFWSLFVWAGLTLSTGLRFLLGQLRGSGR